MKKILCSAEKILTVEVRSNQTFGQSLPFAQFLPTKTMKYDRIPSKASNIGKNRCQFPFQKYSDLPNNRAANLIIFGGKKHLHNLIRTYTFINF